METKIAYEKFAKRFSNGSVATRIVFTNSSDVTAFIYCRTKTGKLAVTEVIDKNGQPMPATMSIKFFSTDEEFDKHHAEHWDRPEALSLGSDAPFAFEYKSEARHNGLTYPSKPTARKLVWQGFLLGLVNASIAHAASAEKEVLELLGPNLESCAFSSAWQKEKYGYD